MWRDRTNLYISYRQSYAHHPAKRTRFAPPNGFGDGGAGAGGGSLYDEERQGLMAGAGGYGDDSGDAVIEMDMLPPRWADIQEEVTEQLRNIAAQSAELDKLHQKHVLPGFDDDRVKRNEEAAIEKRTQEITKAFHSCQRAITQIEAMVRDGKQQGSLTQGDETMARNIQISLAGRVQEASASFRKKQSAYLKKLRHLGGFGSDVERSFYSSSSQNPYSDPSMMESETDKSFSQSTLQQTAQKRVPGNDAVIAQREREINDIATGIIELSDIFKDLQTMVIDQGTMLDRVDYNVERMKTDVKAADAELKVATGYQKKTTKRKIILLLLLVIAGLIIILIVKPKRTKSSPSQDPLPPG